MFSSTHVAVTLADDNLELGSKHVHETNHNAAYGMHRPKQRSTRAQSKHSIAICTWKPFSGDVMTELTREQSVTTHAHIIGAIMQLVRPRMS